MSMTETPAGSRVHIGFFGSRNAGKSSLVNRITGQSLAVVSDVKGTTTDPVYKAMELLPIGPVMVIDTPGFDDEGTLGQLRVEKTRNVLAKTHIAVLVVNGVLGMTDSDHQLIDLFKENHIPYLTVYNHFDAVEAPKADTFYVSAKTGYHIEELKKALTHMAKSTEPEQVPISDCLQTGAVAVLVTPIDSSAPKSRLILPQQMVMRDLLDHHMTVVAVQPEELSSTLENLKRVDVVITDSQAFHQVATVVPSVIPLTSFSILMARVKGFLDTAVQGAYAIDHLAEGATVLIAEGCTHHRQCEDIGTVKLPKLLQDYTGKRLQFCFTSGTEFPYDFAGVDLAIHCGGCMLNNREVLSRMNRAIAAGLPFTNYGTALAHLNGILKRSLEPIAKEK